MHAIELARAAWSSCNPNGSGSAMAHGSVMGHKTVDNGSGFVLNTEFPRSNSLNINTLNLDGTYNTSELRSLTQSSVTT